MKRFAMVIVALMIVAAPALAEIVRVECYGEVEYNQVNFGELAAVNSGDAVYATFTVNSDDYIDSIILWNTVDLGYLTVHAAKAIAEDQVKDGVLDFGRLKSIEVGDGNVYLGKPFIFDKANIDNFDF